MYRRNIARKAELQGCDSVCVCVKEGRRHNWQEKITYIMYGKKTTIQHQCNSPSNKTIFNCLITCLSVLPRWNQWELILICSKFQFGPSKLCMNWAMFPKTWITFTVIACQIFRPSSAMKGQKCFWITLVPWILIILCQNIKTLGLGQLTSEITVSAKDLYYVLALTSDYIQLDQILQPRSIKTIILLWSIQFSFSYFTNLKR